MMTHEDVNVEEQPELTPDEIANIEQDAQHLEAFLGSEESHRSELLEILDHHFVGETNSETSARLFEAVAVYAHDQFAGAFLGYLTFANDPVRTEFERHLSTPTRLYLRKVLAMHGARMAEAATMFGENPMAWRDLQREVFQDVISGDWRVHIEIKTYGGMTYGFDETPTSTLVLTHAMLDTLMTAIQSADVGIVDPGVIPPFRERVIEFLEATETLVEENTAATAGGDQTPDGAYI